ncbi:hypothetical protein JW948_19030 [bacterium]|nr:hypothetical protein [bacterium]
MLNKREILQKILKSEAFLNSQVYQELLTYLFEASIQNITPKEYTIANEVFHKGSTFDPSHDTIVRVYVYNLRKKLEHYYSHEGISDEFRVELPKGHYELTFTRQEKSKNKFLFSHWIWITPLLILLVSNIYFIIRLTRQNPVPRDNKFYRQNEIWGSFFTSPNSKQLVLGDHFFFVKDDADLDRRILLRKDDINSLTEFNDFKSLQPDGQRYIALRFPMFPRNSVWPCMDIIRLFINADQPFELNYASNITAMDIKNDDILFVGSFHTLASFDQTFRKSIFSYQVYPNMLTYHDTVKDSTFTNVVDQNPVFYHTDLGIVRKIPGPNNNVVLIFTSFHETGTIGITKFFTDPARLQELESKFRDKLGYVPQYFEVLFKASGYDRTVYATDIIYLHEIKSEENFW